ncbi:nitrogen fixation protein FixH [Caulobacter sp. BE264]|uniref:FixH family protein n=1 Tax=Caulobacter sp. BE264 TaxID=2817724 RepID=UPI00285B6729|nr:FixH family protein [Caulobacter sp. BE264]MDR7229771.1 nitrogen fixation protein FixH [Caulobacter sp. BE264]
MTIAAQSVTTATSRKGQITGWHVLIGVVAFFVLIIAVDVVFMVLAYRTFSGQVASNPYEAGLAFNKTLAQREREAALGWGASVETESAGAVVVRVRDRAGRPLDRLSVTGSLARPATEVGKQVLDFKPLGDGRYRATAKLDGAWDLRATARDAQNAFELEARLVSQ